MNLRLLALGLFSVLALHASAQTATLSTASPQLDPRGGATTLSATINYDTPPSALGWTVALPEGWTFASVSGPHCPPIAPQAGDTKTLEFAFTEVPPSGATFFIVVNYPAGPGAVAISSEALLRSHNNERKIKTSPLKLSSP